MNLNTYPNPFSSSTVPIFPKHLYGSIFPNEDTLKDQFIIITDVDTVKPLLWKLCTEDSVTAKPYEVQNLENEINSIFTNAKDEIFEDGIESNFSRSLINYIQIYNDLAIDALTTIILSNQHNASIFSEALRWIGKLEHPQTHFSRLLLLERCLFNKSYYIRDGALLGIEFLDDKNAINTIKIAIEKETIPELREYMYQVIYYLEMD